MKEASFYKSLDNKSVQCTLCPHNCTLGNGRSGICLVRKNVDGRLITQVYGKPVSIHSDPVEKKPLYHFYPGYQVLSFGTFGCNLKCKFCQNCDISQRFFDDNRISMEKSPEDMMEMVLLKHRNIGLAYTYNEPLVFYEYMMDLANLVKSKGMKNIMVSNGFINPEPLKELIEVTDAFNIDLKSFDNDFYRIYTKSSLDPVLNTIASIAASGKHMELTFLVIPGLNDSFDEFESMTDWILDTCGKSTVLHISRYFPAYKMEIPPTPLKTLENLYSIARKKLNFVYIGNVHENFGRDTFCPVCKKILISRSGYYTTIEGLESSGNCKYCGEAIIKNMIL